VVIRDTGIPDAVKNFDASDESAASMLGVVWENQITGGRVTQAGLGGSSPSRL
jgi:hypothetical protein